MATYDGTQALGSFVETAAAASLDDAIAAIRSGTFARPSRYEVQFFPPASLLRARIGERASRVQSEEMQQLMMRMQGPDARNTALRCQSFEFPGRTLDTGADINIYGPTREMVQGYSFADTTAVFQCSSDMKEKRFFEVWQRLAYNNQTWAMQYYDDYVGAIKIHQLDETDTIKYGVELVEAFPKTIAAQSLNYSTVNIIQTVSVTFSYRYWKDLVDEADLPKPYTEEAVVNTGYKTVTGAL